MVATNGYCNVNPACKLHYVRGEHSGRFAVADGADPRHVVPTRETLGLVNGQYRRTLHEAFLHGLATAPSRIRSVADPAYGTLDYTASAPRGPNQWYSDKPGQRQSFSWHFGGDVPWCSPAAIRSRFVGRARSSRVDRRTEGRLDDPGRRNALLSPGPLGYCFAFDPAHHSIRAERHRGGGLVRAAGPGAGRFRDRALPLPAQRAVAIVRGVARRSPNRRQAGPAGPRQRLRHAGAQIRPTSRHRQWWANGSESAAATGPSTCDCSIMAIPRRLPPTFPAPSATIMRQASPGPRSTCGNGSRWKGPISGRSSVPRWPRATRRSSSSAPSFST